MCIIWAVVSTSTVQTRSQAMRLMVTLKTRSVPRQRRLLRAATAAAIPAVATVTHTSMRIVFIYQLSGAGIGCQLIKQKNPSLSAQCKQQGRAQIWVFWVSVARNRRFNYGPEYPAAKPLSKNLFAFQQIGGEESMPELTVAPPRRRCS